MKSISAEQLLIEHGVKPTPQRVVITRSIIESKEHPTADDVHHAVKGKLPVLLSRATVYNTLNTLVAAGVIKELNVQTGRTRYDANLARHHHFVDVKSGKIVDIPWELVPELPASLSGKYKVRSYEVTFFGEMS